MIPTAIVETRIVFSVPEFVPLAVNDLKHRHLPGDWPTDSQRCRWFPGPILDLQLLVLIQDGWCNSFLPKELLNWDLLQELKMWTLKKLLSEGDHYSSLQFADLLLSNRDYASIVSAKGNLPIVNDF